MEARKQAQDPTNDSVCHAQNSRHWLLPKRAEFAESVGHCSMRKCGGRCVWPVPYGAGAVPLLPESHTGGPKKMQYGIHLCQPRRALQC